MPGISLALHNKYQAFSTRVCRILHKTVFHIRPSTTNFLSLLSRVLRPVNLETEHCPNHLNLVALCLPCRISVFILHLVEPVNPLISADIELAEHHDSEDLRESRLQGCVENLRWIMNLYVGFSMRGWPMWPASRLYQSQSPHAITQHTCKFAKAVKRDELDQNSICTWATKLALFSQEDLTHPWAWVNHPFKYSTVQGRSCRLTLLCPS